MRCIHNMLTVQKCIVKFHNCINYPPFYLNLADVGTNCVFSFLFFITSTRWPLHSSLVLVEASSIQWHWCPHTDREDVKHHRRPICWLDGWLCRSFLPIMILYENHYIGQEGLHHWSCDQWCSRGGAAALMTMPEKVHFLWNGCFTMPVSACTVKRKRVTTFRWSDMVHYCSPLKEWITICSPHR